jgi:hypothetical protein
MLDHRLRQCSWLSRQGLWKHTPGLHDVKPGREADLLRAIEDGTLGRGSVAGDEFLRNMQEARIDDDGKVEWVEICFCYTPLEEERAYWEEYFQFEKVQDAHARKHCRDENGTEPWACCDCDCTVRLEAKLAGRGRPFMELLREVAADFRARSTADMK